MALGTQEMGYLLCIGMVFPLKVGDNHIAFYQGWTDFTAAASNDEESVFLIKVDPLEHNIGLNFVEIMN